MRRLLATFFALLPSLASAEPPRVVTDIPPVHALVASVMTGVGRPALLLPPGASPHDYALRPSQAQTLARADIVIWIGPDLSPWLGRAMATLGRDAWIVGLLAAPDTVTLRYATGHDQDDHGRQEGVDPHAWLDPANARVWLVLIADILAQADPANAEVYRQNTSRAIAGLKATEKIIEGLIGPARGRDFVLYHDGFRYLQSAFSLQPLAVIADGDAVRPGAARLAEIREVLRSHRGACLFLEPQIPDRAAKAVTEGTGARVAVLDPLGAGIEPGPDLYTGMMIGIAKAMHDCLVR